MPYIQIRLHNPRPGTHQALATEVTRLMAEVMGKRREVTVVEIVPTHGAWFAAGATVTGPLAYVDVKITRDTNSLTEKAALLAQLHGVLERELGPLAAPAYCVIHEIPATDWGYDGLPQATRLAVTPL